MTTPQDEKGLLAVLVQRLESHRIPRALEIKEVVDRGEKLNEHDLRFLQEIMADAKNIAPMLASHPELRELASKVTTLYREITETALENEKAG